MTSRGGPGHRRGAGAAQGSLGASALLALSLLGCAAGAPLAEVGAAAPDAVTSDGPVERYALGPSEIHVEVDVSAGSAYTLRFGEVSGVFALVPDALEASSVEVNIRTPSVDSTIGLVADVARDEFLHAASYPEASFVSRALRTDAAGQLTLYGDLSLHGVTKALAVPARLTVERCRARAQVAFAVNRRVFGVVSSGAVDGVVSDTVEVRIEIETARRGC